jgi:hypothetical protein
MDQLLKDCNRLREIAMTFRLDGFLCERFIYRLSDRTERREQQYDLPVHSLF